MPTKTHANLGEVLQTQYFPGVILEIFDEDSAIPAEKWDTAKVSCPWGVTEMPLFYHCEHDVQERSNGALVGAAAAFDEGDEVLVMAKSSVARVGQSDVSDPMVISHWERPRRCRPGWVVVIIKIEQQQWLTIYNIRTKKVASIPRPTGGMYSFPCTFEIASPILDARVRKDASGQYQWDDEELFTETVQTPEEGMQVAGGTPNWRDDFNGDIIRNGAPPSAWWSSYDYLGNPTYRYFWEAQSALLTDLDGVVQGTFTKAMAIADTFASKGWAGPGVCHDSRHYQVGATGVRGEETLPAMSLHQQVAYGENEFWVCGRNIYLGMIVSFCDAAWKYVRFDTLPNTIPNANDAMDRVASWAAFSQALPGAGVVGLLSNVGMAVAASQFSDFGGIFTFAALKRINEGALHRTSYPVAPAQRWLSPGSFRLEQRPIPGVKDVITPDVTARNCRLERVSAWVRYDNWQNTLGLSSSMAEADRTWFFRVWATQTSYDASYWDTPLGTMFYAAPWQRTVLWWMYGLTFSSADLTARQDWPIKTDHWAVARQTSRALLQIYVVHRRGITLTGPALESAGRFWIQETLTPPWDCLPAPADLGEPVEQADTDTMNAPPETAYAGYVQNGQRHVSTLTPAEIMALLEPLRFIHTGSADIPSPLRSNRNEIEIMAAADMYGTLQRRTGGKRPQDQERDAGLEHAIADVIKMALEQSNSPLATFEVEAHIL